MYIFYVHRCPGGVQCLIEDVKLCIYLTLEGIALGLFGVFNERTCQQYTLRYTCVVRMCRKWVHFVTRSSVGIVYVQVCE